MTQVGGSESGAIEPPAIRASVMMPIVFCASFVPWASETSPAEAIWPTRKPLSAALPPAFLPRA